MKSKKVLVGLGICLGGMAFVSLGVHFVPLILESLGYGRSAYYRAYHQGDHAVAVGDYRRAIDEYSKMIAMSPNKSEGYHLRALAEYRTKRYDLVIADDTKAIALLSTPAGINEIGLYPNADDAYKRNLALLTQSILYSNRANAYQIMGDYSHALTDLTLAISINPGNKSALVNRARIYHWMKRYNDALADGQAIVRYDPGKPENYYFLGQLYQTVHQPRHAIAAFSTAITLDPHKIAYYDSMSQVCEEVHDYKTEMSAWQTACAAMPTNADARGGYGWALYLNGKFAESIANSQQTIEMNPDAVYARYNIGLCYAVQNDWVDAKTAYETAHSFSKTNDTVGALTDVQTALKAHPTLSALKSSKLLLESYIN